MPPIIILQGQTDSHLSCLQLYDITVWCRTTWLGRTWCVLGGNLRPVSQHQFTTWPDLKGSNPCAKEVWVVSLQSRNSYHLDFSKGIHHTVVFLTAGTTKWWMEQQARKDYAHTLTSSLFVFPLYTLGELTHMCIHTDWSKILGRLEKFVSCGPLQSHSQVPWP